MTMTSKTPLNMTRWIIQWSWVSGMVTISCLFFSLQQWLLGMNTFIGTQNRRWTCISPDGITKNEIDFIISDQKYIVKDHFKNAQGTGPLNHPQNSRKTLQVSRWFFENNEKIFSHSVYQSADINIHWCDEKKYFDYRYISVK